MRVWTLQSYGVSYYLNELLTVKCDYIVARHEIQESILIGRPRYNPHQTESTSVFIKELFSMCIEIEPIK